MNAVEPIKDGKSMLMAIVTILLVVSVAANVYLADRFDLFIKLVRKIEYKLDPVTNIEPPSSSSVSGKPLVAYFLDKKVEPVQQSEASDAPELPSDLIISPGCYKIRGKCYDLTSDGLYRYMEFPGYNVQRIVYSGNTDALISGICWIATHGQKDDLLSDEELTERALSSKIFVTCGRQSEWALGLLREQKINARLVACKTDEEWNGFDDGHVMISVFREHLDKWVVYDLDKNCYFVDSDTKMPLSLIEFYESQDTNNYEIIKLSNGYRVDSSSYTNYEGNDLSLLMEYALAEPRGWYRRVMKVPMIYDSESECYYFFNYEQRKRLQAFASNYRFMEKKEFVRKFYPNDSNSKQID